MFAQNKFLIVGLGNIGPDYFMTRHNVGFLCLDSFAHLNNLAFFDKRYGFISQYKIKNKSLLLLKPSTFMNLSGKAIAFYMNNEKICLSRLLVITDDIALPFGSIRIRKKGGAGGHNGLQNIIDVIGTSDFARIRIGIGSQFVRGYQSNYVLGEWDEVETPFLKKITDRVNLAINEFVLAGIDIAMNKYNKPIV